MSAGAVLRDARRRAGLTQQELARRAGTSQSHVARIEADLLDPRWSTLRSLVAACGLDLEVAVTEPSGHDLSLIDDTLQMSVEERVDALIARMRLAEELQAAVNPVRAG